MLHLLFYCIKLTSLPQVLLLCKGSVIFARQRDLVSNDMRMTIVLCTYYYNHTFTFDICLVPWSSCSLKNVQICKLY